MKKTIPVPVGVAILVGVVVAIVFFTWKALAPRASGGTYTPGVPPWMDPREKGNAASGPTGDTPTGAPVPGDVPAGKS